MGGVSPEIFYSDSPATTDLSTAAPRTLKGETVFGNIYAFVKGHESIEEVEFFLDDPSRQGEPFERRTEAPFGASLDTSEREDGQHALTVVITRVDGAPELVGTSDFVVQNDESVPADPEEPGPTDPTEPTPTIPVEPTPADPEPAPAEADYYVATDGSDSNDGRTEGTAFRTIQRAADVAGPGDVVYIRGGVYRNRVDFTASGTKDAPITFSSYPDEWAILDGSEETPYQSRAQLRVVGSSWIVFKNFEIRNSARQGILLERSNHNVLDNIVTRDNTNSGVQLVDSSNNKLLNIEAYGNYDANNPNNGLDGDNADGIGISSGDGNYIYNCEVHGNSDDGLDTWLSTNTVVDGCVAYDNGRGSDGNGNGIKAGGEHKQVNTVVRNSIAYNNRSNGIDYNQGRGVRFINNTSFNNGRSNYSAAYATLKNNISYGSGNLDFSTGNTQEANSWNLSIDDPRFVSTDPASASFLTLAPNSPAIDKGVDVGLPYDGAAPDLGALELGISLADR